MTKEEFYFPSADGKTQVHAVCWLPETPRAVLQLSHGISEYADRYDDFAAWLCARGFVVVGNDHLGHGQSVTEGAARMHFGPKGSWEHVTADLYTLYGQTRRQFPHLPYFLLGHSMGSFLARTFLIRYPGTVDAVILMGTGQMPPALVRGGLMIATACGLKNGWEKPSAIVDQLAFGAYNAVFAPNRTSHDWLSVNEKNVDAFLADPLCVLKPSIGTFREMLHGIRFITNQKNVEKMNRNTPVLFLSGAMDPVGDCGKGVERAASSFRKAGVSRVEVILYPELRHEILNEDCRENIYGDIFAWFQARMAEKSPAAR